jgi:glutamate-1-semialdehyde 2,1-aminomutase
MTEMKKLFERACKVIPYGVNSNFRYWGDDTLVIVRGEGSYIWDANGTKYIDFRNAWGPVILGHAYPKVVERVQEVLYQGNIFASTTPLEIEVAEHIIRMCKVDKVRLSNTGTEATMHALRVARAYNGREKFIKFEGQYHGMCDYYLFSTAGTPVEIAGSRRSPNSVQMSSGIPRAISDYVITLLYNDIEMLVRTVRARWGEIAAIIVEPIMGNVASVMPKPGFLETIRSLCNEYSIVMIMDEVKTGFRIANGGAQEFFDIKADLVTYAKALGNGFPIAAIGGKEDVMMTIEPGKVAMGGTYTGHGVGVAAAIATLEIMEKQPIIHTINKHGKLLMSGIGEILSDAGIPHAFQGPPPMFGFVLGTETPAHDFRSYQATDTILYEKISKGLMKRGVFPDIHGREPWFLNYSLSELDITDTLTAFEDAVRETKKSEINSME